MNRSRLWPLVGSLCVAAAAAAAAPIEIAPPTSIELIGHAEVEEASFESEPVGGLSGLVWEHTSGRWLALSDDPSERAPARFDELAIDLGDGRLDAGDVVVVGRVHLGGPGGGGYPRGTLDPEGFALGPGGTLFFSSEGVARRGIAPFVARLDRDGREAGRLPLAARFAPDGEQRRGVRPNLGFESLTVTPDGRWLVAGLENALVQDGPAADVGAASPARVVLWPLEDGGPARELVYRTEPVISMPPTDDSLRVAGLVDLLALGGERFLALEREYVAGVGLRVALYLADATGATDVAARDTLGDDIMPIAKRRLLDFADLGIALDNFEGIALGPRLADGRRSLLAIVDDNFNRSVQRTLLVAFALDDQPITISSIQGAGHRSPIEGRWVDGVDGVVTAIDARARPPAFFVESSRPDDEAGTSEGLRVAAGELELPAPGTAVRLAGRVVERAYDERQLPVTTIEALSVEPLAGERVLPPPVRIGTDRIVPAIVDGDGMSEFRPRHDALDLWESLEGMRVELPAGIVTGPTLGYDELVLLPESSAAGPRTAAGGLLLTPAGPSLDKVIVSGRLSGGLPRVAVGSRIAAPVVGVVDYSFANYKVLATAPVEAEPVPAGCGSVTRLGSSPGSVTLATFNVENLSAADDEERFRLAGRVVARTLGGPAIVVLEEIQDDSGRQRGDGVVSSERTLARLTEAILAAGGPRYEPVVIDPELDREGGVPGGNIRVALLYDPRRIGLERRGTAGPLDATGPELAGGELRLRPNPGRVAPRGSAFTLTSGEGVRRSLAVELRVDGEPLFVVANHWSSKFDDDRDFGAVQPPRRPTGAKRRAQAAEIRAFVDRLLAIDPRARVAVVGDLNDLPWSEPIERVAAPPLENLIGRLPEASRYTYNFEGSAQAIDHVVVSPSLADGAEIEVLHVSSDCPERQRASDHDPVIVRLPIAPR